MAATPASTFRMADGRHNVPIGAHAHDQDAPVQTIEPAPAVLS